MRTGDRRAPRSVQGRRMRANAGGLPKGWKVGRLFRKHTSEARNELIAGALYRGGFVETWGRGIEKVCRECE